MKLHKKNDVALQDLTPCAWGILGAWAVVTGSQRITHAIQKTGIFHELPPC
jgi:hypothetical protein